MKVFHILSLFLNTGKGHPNDLERDNNKAKPIPPDVLPTVEQAVELFEQDGGHLTIWPEFGFDPLASSEHLAKRRFDSFHQSFPNMATIFHHVINDDALAYKNALFLFRDLTNNLSQNL